MDKNYITNKGFESLKAELNQFLNHERPEMVKTVAWAASNGDRSENADYHYGKKRLREIDRKIRFLNQRIEAAEVVDPSKLKTDKVVFGSTISIERESGDKQTYQIVGEDEIDTENKKISWKSPLAKALLGKSVGDEVELKKPKETEWIVLLGIK